MPAEPLRRPGVIAVKLGNGDDDTLASFRSRTADSSTVLAIPVAFAASLPTSWNNTHPAPVQGVMFVPLLGGDALGVVVEEVELWDLRATPGVVDVDLETHYWDCPGPSIGGQPRPCMLLASHRHSLARVVHVTPCSSVIHGSRTTY